MKKALIKYCSYRDYVLFTLGINVGLRVSDILKLQVKDVRGKTHIQLREQKTKKVSRFYLPAPLRELLEDYTKELSSEAYLFPSRKGDKPISTTQAYRILNKAGSMIDLEAVGTHTMRKTFGYHYYKRTKDVATLMEIFNHSAPSITKRYIGITQDEIDKSLEDFML
ncbi:site-specific integrase [Bacillus sp. EB600]|uniref:site-specific integrase n=1 Tax=Bacillus sp. EB600 TaxID=2806345 RepID=UPI00210DD1CA|nr:site-specific integrase [Bacillus sp. EB600]